MRIKITPEELKAIIDATESKFSDQRSLASVRTKLYQALSANHASSRPVTLDVQTLPK